MYLSASFSKSLNVSDVNLLFFERGRIRRSDPLTMKKTTVSFEQLDIMIFVVMSQT